MLPVRFLEHNFQQFTQSGKTRNNLNEDHVNREAIILSLCVSPLEYKTEL
jgi:hypothetical protein